MNRIGPASLLAFAALTLATSASARAPRPQNDAPNAAQNDAEGGDKTLKKAGDIASQPIKDVGIQKTRTPEILQTAAKQPYAQPKNRSCKGYAAAIAELNAVLGPDFGGNSAENQNKFGKLAAAGGEAVVNSLIPFRGLVREVSGAAPAERRLDAAINAGLARRGFLRGNAVAKGCKIAAGGPIRITPKK